MILIIKHIEIEGPGTLGDFLKQKGWQSKIIELGKGDSLPSLDDCQAVISLGGPMNVYEEDKYPFLKEEDKFLRAALEKEVPVLGICLGAQLLAKACGARISKAPQKEIGWRRLDLTEAGKEDGLFAGLPQRLNVFQWHEDTFEIPKAALRLAESAACPNQAFRFGRNAYGLQFHLEVTPKMVESWINEYVKETQAGVEFKNMLIEAHKRKEAFEKQANLIYLNFTRTISCRGGLNLPYPVDNSSKL